MKITEQSLDGIPITIYEKDDLSEKPLIYFFHGFTGNKDKNIMGRGEVLAKMGYYVVAIDAYLHGKRQPLLEKKRTNQSKYEDIIEVIMHTANDAKTLFHKYFKHFKQVRQDKYHAYGVSMGSLTAFYLATIDCDLEAVAALVCTPSILSYYEDKARQYHFNTGFFYDRKIAYYETICPLIHFDRLKSTKIFMGCGLNDMVVSPAYAKDLKSKLSDKTLMFYDTGHVSTSEMLEDSYQFLKEVLTYGTID